MQVVETTGAELTGTAAAAVRNPDILTEYSAGPYIDPQDGRTRHDEHDIQRVDQSATWNLRPQGGGAYGAAPVLSAKNSAQSTPISAEFELEFERQKAYSLALQEQNAAMLIKIEAVNRVLVESEKDTAQNAELKQQIEALREEVNILKNPAPVTTQPTKIGLGQKFKNFFGYE